MLTAFHSFPTPTRTNVTTLPALPPLPPLPPAACAVGLNASAVASGPDDGNDGMVDSSNIYEEGTEGNNRSVGEVSAEEGGSGGDRSESGDHDHAAAEHSTGSEGDAHSGMDAEESSYIPSEEEEEVMEELEDSTEL
jgi:hypothetical protein